MTPADAPAAADRDDGVSLDSILATVGAQAARGDLAGAYGTAERALAHGRVHPVLFRMRGAARAQQGRFHDAAADFAAALGLAPRDAATLSALGLCLGHAGRLEEAARTLDDAVALEPTRTEAHFRRGWVAEGLGDYATARAAYERAAHGAGQPEALGSAALIAARQGLWDDVRRYATAAGRSGARSAPLQLALAALELADGRAEAADRRLRALLAAPALDTLVASTARRQLGDVLDRLDRRPEAFAAWTEGAAELRRAVAPRFAAGGAERGAAMAARLDRSFSAQEPRRWRRPASTAAARGPATRHAFLLGFPRSGTTLVNQALANCPGVVVADERELLADAARTFLRDHDGIDRLAGASELELDEQRALYWRRVRQAGLQVEGSTFVDKLPLNSLGLPLISKLFPDAKVIYMVRDPRAVVLSCLQQRFVLNSGTFELLTLADAAAFYDACARVVETYRRVIDLDLREQGYERLIADFEGETRAICEHIGAQWSPDVRRFDRRAASGAVATPSTQQLARGLFTDGVAGWRRYEAALEPVASVLSPWARRFGYEADARRPAG